MRRLVFVIVLVGALAPGQAHANPPGYPSRFAALTPSGTVASRGHSMT